MLTRRSLLALALLPWASPAFAADITVPTVSGRYASVCADSGVLSSIANRFAWAERNTWHRGIVLHAIENPRPSNHPYYEPGLVARDYCVAEAVLTNGEIRPVYYAIEHGLGFAGVGRSVDFCVLGLDPWHVHDGACRTVR
jgi:hypothetical protein